MEGAIVEQFHHSLQLSYIFYLLYIFVKIGIKVLNKEKQKMKLKTNYP